jgi:hypothetical protein
VVEADLVEWLLEVANKFKYTDVLAIATGNGFHDSEQNATLDGQPNALIDPGWLLNEY